MSDNINEEIMNNLPEEENATDAIGASDDIEDIEDEIYTLTDEEGNEARFELAGTRELNGETYYALIPIENDKDEYVILKSEISENNEEMLESMTMMSLTAFPKYLIMSFSVKLITIYNLVFITAPVKVLHVKLFGFNGIRL